MQNCHVAFECLLWTMGGPGVKKVKNHLYICIQYMRRGLSHGLQGALRDLLSSTNDD